jgi:hypothetical protein
MGLVWGLFWGFISYSAIFFELKRLVCLGFALLLYYAQLSYYVLHASLRSSVFVVLLRAKALRTHFVLFARDSIRSAHVSLCSIVCPLCRCTPSCTHSYLIVRSLTYSLHSYCSLALCLVHKCTRLYVSSLRSSSCLV